MQNKLAPFGCLHEIFDKDYRMFYLNQKHAKCQQKKVGGVRFLV